jgi:hypothetical protein
MSGSGVNEESPLHFCRRNQRSCYCLILFSKDFARLCMKSLMVILGIVLGVVAIAIRLLGLVPSGLGNSRRRNAVGNRFLLGVGVVCLAVIFVWFWLVMKAR